MVFPEAFGKCASVLEAGAMVVVKGKVELDDETIRMTANEVLPIEAMRQKMSRELSIKLTSPPHGRQTFEALADLFARHRGDRRVVLELELRDQQPPLRAARAARRAGARAALRAAGDGSRAHLRRRDGCTAMTLKSHRRDAETQRILVLKESLRARRLCGETQNRCRLRHSSSKNRSRRC